MGNSRDSLARKLNLSFLARGRSSTRDSPGLAEGGHHEAGIEEEVHGDHLPRSEISDCNTYMVFGDYLAGFMWGSEYFRYRNLFWPLFLGLWVPGVQGLTLKPTP